ncbi:hypothetical protein CC80DRAFT_590195 [Byssothecium circinans]|uniref:Uncharacterized protein n=1 Tax=Byssothecium circinans TaxID=147558 RepID=A0A6A5UD89_9PLEO|nr:hypothetical protein CC80DRAFT_590195 [Byssothecium circinans]
MTQSAGPPLRLFDFALGECPPNDPTKHPGCQTRPAHPPTSTDSVKSHASNLAAAGLERIYLISCDDDGADQPVISRSAPVKHNLIGDKVLYGRSLGASTDPVDELVSVPLPSGGQRWEKVTTVENLTWRRRKEFTTNVDTFYIVSTRLLDSDVILGSDGSLELQFPSDVQEAHSPQARYQRGGFVEMEELDLAVPPYATTVPMHSYQNRYKLGPHGPPSNSRWPQLRHSYQQTSMPLNVQRKYDSVQAFRDTQRMHEAEPTAPAPHPRHIDHGQPTHTTTPFAAQGSTASDRLVGQNTNEMSFDPDASGEAFYQAFHQWAVRRKRGGDLERHRMTLWLKASKNTPEDEAYELSLNEGELEELWETAVDWIRENKSPKAPHLYATVELEGG